MYNYLKHHIWFNLKLKMVNVLVLNSCLYLFLDKRLVLYIAGLVALYVPWVFSI